MCSQFFNSFVEEKQTRQVAKGKYVNGHGQTFSIYSPFKIRFFFEVSIFSLFNEHWNKASICMRKGLFVEMDGDVKFSYCQIIKMSFATTSHP